MFFWISELFESIKEKFEALESQNVPMNDAVTQTMWSDTKLTEDEEKNYFRVDYDLNYYLNFNIINTRYAPNWLWNGFIIHCSASWKYGLNSFQFKWLNILKLKGSK